MKSGILNAVEAKKTFAARIRIVATAILTMLCVVLPLFALPAAETEAAKYSLPKNRIFLFLGLKMPPNEI